MRTLAVLAVLVRLAGCDVVFPLEGPERTDAPDAAEDIDGPPPRCPSGADATRHVFPAVADTILSSGAPAQNSGTLGVATISGDLGPMGSRGMFRFLIGEIDAAAVLDLRLVLPSAMTSDDCSTACGACAGIEKAGVMRAFPANGAWVESEATWERASNVLAWELPGASGATDRGPEIVPAPEHAISMDTTFAADAGMFASILAWKIGSQLSFVVETKDAKQVVRTRENVCDGGASGARLEILGC
jgi:hypothetical protein